MQDRKIKVLYIAGFGRSGSTILDNLLGQVSGFFSAGELCYTWAHNLAENGLCGCGAPPADCEVWGPVFGNLADTVDPSDMARLEREALRTRHLPLMLFPPGKRILEERLGGYVPNLDGFYREMQRVTGCRVIVDSSKSPSYGYAIGLVPAIDLHVVHLVRDPRATAYSWLKKKLQPDRGEEGYMDQHHPTKSSLMWTVWNAAAEALWRRSRERYLLLRYEDLVADPRAALLRVLELVGEGDRDLPFVRGSEVDLGINHTVAGNPNRFRTGTVKLRLDDEWKRRMRLRDRVLVTLLTLPVLTRYGYSIGAVAKAGLKGAGAADRQGVG